MKIKPKGDYILLSVEKYDDNKHVIIPSHLRKKLPIGAVLDWGDYCKGDYAKGEVVIFNKQGTKAIPNTDLVLCPEHRIHVTEKWLKESIKKYNDVQSTSKEKGN
jgi:hypothetical protein